MNILWLNHRDPKHPKAGGAERTIFEVSKRFVQQGNKVTLYCPHWKGSKNEENYSGIRIIRKGGNISTHILLPIFIFRNKFDIVINDMAHGIPWISPVLLEKNNVVFFRHLHRRSLPGQVNIFLAKIITFMEKMYPFIYRNKTFITESETSKNDLIDLGIKKENIVKIPPGVDLDFFHPGEKTKSVQLLYFGGLRRYKRPEYAIRVYEELKNKIDDLKLIITGEGPLLDKMKKGKDYNIEFVGKIDYMELSRIIRESWINLHFSVTEGWGYSILEASASGTPTVAFRVPGVVDTVVDGINGFLVNDISEFKDKILYILKNEDLFIKKSRDFAENFKWDKTVEMWDQVFNSNKKG